MTLLQSHAHVADGGGTSRPEESGFSSLRHIVLTAPDVLKIDRSIVAGLDDDPVLTTLVRSLVDFGRGLHAKVVAEGVETAAEAAALRELGVDLGQGWFFGRPGPPEALTDVISMPVPRSEDVSLFPHRTVAHR